MASVRQELGIYWDTEGLFCVETQAAVAVKTFFIPFPVNIQTPGEKKYSGTSADLGSLILKAFHEHNIRPATVNVCLPTKDIIFRSFIIPWMQNHEIKNVVHFEASKYIPFPLKDLAYCFYPIFFKANDLRRIRVIFAAIKKDILEYYIQSFMETKLDVNVIEPAPLSLTRIFVLKNLIASEQTFAVLQYQGREGKIIIVDQGVPQFVREFRLDSQQNVESQQSLTHFLANEVTISMEYVNRQNNLRIEQLVFVSSTLSQEIVLNLEQELELPVIALSSETVFEKMGVSDVGYLQAYGAALTSTVSIPAELFLFSKKAGQTGKPQQAQSAQLFNYKSITKTLIFCAMFLLMNFFLSYQFQSQDRQTLLSLKQKLGASEASSMDTLKADDVVLQKKLDYFNNLRIKTEASHVLTAIPNLLTKGTWLKTLTISYKNLQDGKKQDKNSPVLSAETLMVDLEGYNYSENQEKQFSLVNLFLKNLKEDTYFSKRFEKIQIETIRAQKLEGQNVTAFKIQCQ